ncbi:MAG TPA: hypothetical protein VIH42_14475, partial [Thermoguttaceae bacterium]
MTLRTSNKMNLLPRPKAASGSEAPAGLIRYCILKAALKRFILLAVLLPLAILILSIAVYNPAAVNAASIAAKMDTFTTPDGANYFALSIKPEGIAQTAEPRDVLVMFNTSAGQTGEFRTKALEVLRSLLGAMPAGDRIQLMAVDLNATRLTKTFV